MATFGESLQENVGSGRAGGGGQLHADRRHHLLGGIGYALDAWRGTSPWFLLGGLSSGSSSGSTSWRRPSGDR